MLTRMVVGVDGSRISEAAAQAALSLAVQSHAQVYLISVVRNCRAISRRAKRWRVRKPKPGTISPPATSACSRKRSAKA